jgi:hypothetical protein
MGNITNSSQKFLSNALNLRIHPRLANLGERRQLLAKLKEFGDVLVFKSLFVSGYRKRKPAVMLTESSMIGFLILRTLHW